MDNDFYDYVFNNNDSNSLLMKSYENVIVEKPYDSVIITLNYNPSQIYGEWCITFDVNKHKFQIDKDFFLDSYPRDILYFFTYLIKHVSKSRTSL